MALKQTKITIVSIVAVLTALFLIFRAPFCIDKSQDIVIKKLSGLSNFVEKEGTLRLDVGKKLADIAAQPQKYDVPNELTNLANKLKSAAQKELKNPKLKGAGEKLSKAAAFIEAQAKVEPEKINYKALSEKAGMLIAAGNKMIKKSDRLVQMAALRMYISSFWRGVLVFGGLFIFLSVYALRLGKEWAYPSIVTIMALAPIGAFYISLAGAVFFGVPNGFTVFGVGLVAFLIVLTLGLEDKKEKAVYLPIMILLGMIGVDAFSFAEHGIRGILALPYAATATNPAQAILRFTGPIAFLTLIMAIIAIYKLAAKNPSGWWYAMMAAMGMMFVGFPADWVRHKDSVFIMGFSTSTYLVGGILGLILFVLLLIPYFKQELMKEEK
jgi:hypothetical protein